MSISIKPVLSVGEESPVRFIGKKGKVIVNVANTEYEVVKKVAKEHFQWKLTEYPQSDWDLTWTDTAVPTEKLSKMKPYQKINHFPGMHGICKKHYLAWNLNKMQKIFPQEYSFYPKTWVLPGDYSDLKLHADRRRTFIVKPEASSQGQGIYLLKKFEDINLSERLVVQEYINSPFLINGLKFDFRVYVLVTGCNPLRAFIHEEGLTRFATEPYSPPVEENFTNSCMHLTNYAINKNSSKFVHNKSEFKDDEGHKRSLSSTFRLLSDIGCDVEALKQEIEKMICKTLCCVQPALSYHYQTCQPGDQSNSMCFELLGFDVILDRNLKPWLLEVNHSPSFTTDSPLDYKIKYVLIKETMQMLNLNVARRQAYSKVNKTRYFSMQKTRNPEFRNPTAQNESQKDSWESSNQGGFKALILPENIEKLTNFMQTAQKVWSEISKLGVKKPAFQSKLSIKSIPKNRSIQARKKLRISNSIKPSQSLIITEESKDSDVLEIQKLIDSNKLSFNFLNGKDLIYYNQLNDIFKHRRHSITFLKGTEFHNTVFKLLKPIEKPKEVGVGSFVAPKSFNFIPACINKIKPYK